MDNHVHITAKFAGRTSNVVLETYRAFWFAALHGLPPDSVVFCDSPELHSIVSQPIFDVVAPHFVSADEYRRIGFHGDSVVSGAPGSSVLVYDCGNKDPCKVRSDLAGLSLSDGALVELRGFYFIYPEYPWERSLFARLFGNVPYRDSVARRHADILSGSTVGYTVRRTDTVRRNDFRTLSEDRVVADIRDIVRRYNGFVRVLLTSDDIGFVDNLLAVHGDLMDYVYVVRENTVDTLYLLSMCDYVLANGQCQCSISYTHDPGFVYESTFGQVAQILGRSYKYSCLPCAPDSHASRCVHQETKLARS